MSSSVSRPSIGFALARHMILGARHFGGCPKALAAELGVSLDEDASARVPIHRLSEALLPLAVGSGTPHLGIELARVIPVGGLGLADYAWSTSATLFEALAQASLHVDAINNALRLELHVDGNVARIVQEHVVRSPPVLFTELTAAIIAVRMRHVLGGVAFTAVRFAHAVPETTAPYDAFFGVKVEFGASADEVVVPLGLLEAPLLTADRETSALLKEHRRAVMRGRRAAAGSLHARVRELADRAFAEGAGELELATAAERLQIPARSLQRRLEMKDTSFSALVDDARRDAAIRLLAREREPIPKVASRLGFTNRASFFRAFRRWTGTSPAAYRRAAPAESHGPQNI